MRLEMCHSAVFKGYWGVAEARVVAMAQSEVYCLLGKFQSESGLLVRGVEPRCGLMLAKCHIRC